MPKTDWQALGRRIAREVMGWVQWDELSADNQQLIPIYNRRTWLTLDELGCPHSTDLLYKDWQPHKDVAQALMAKDHIVKQAWPGCRFTMDSVQHSGSRAWFRRGEQIYHGDHKTDAKVICLAIEEWMDAQKELQDDPE